MHGLATYWHTLRHLKPVQLYGRIWFSCCKPQPDRRPAPQLRHQGAGVWVQPAKRKPSLLAPTQFCFLNETHDLTDHGWDDPSVAKLWRYNLHYFDDLNARDGPTRKQWHDLLLLRWVRENPPATGAGWEPYPTSLRIANWIKWSLMGNALPAGCVQSLAVQVRWLVRRLEIHLLGNHLFANAKALMFAGLFFEGPEAEGWLEKGLRILEREMVEQILSDGGHFERSPMYHALILEDIMDLCNIAAAFPDVSVEGWRATLQKWRIQVQRMRHWMSVMCHPDGDISFFNDAALNVAPPPVELEGYAGRLKLDDLPTSVEGLIQLEASGYIRVESEASVALLDVAPMGPDYLPAHGHADTLSFELSLFGQRVLVNSGTSCYGSGAERLRQRGTAAHNSVEINRQSSSQIWSGFRVAKRAYPVGLHVIRNGTIEVECSHDGYRRLRGRPVHQRQWRFRGNEMTVQDRISGRFEQAQARFHLHPLVTLADGAVDARDGVIKLQLPQGQTVDFSVEGGVLRSEMTTWHPEFGLSQPNHCLVVEFRGSSVRTRIAWNNPL